MNYDENFIKDFHEAAESGNSGAQVQLGHCYANGDGVKSNCNTAIMWYSRAAKQGNRNGIISLINCYVFQWISTPNPNKKILALTRKLALMGDSMYQELLGNAYYDGTELKNDYRKAAYWYRKAALRGNGNALEKLANSTTTAKA